MHFRAFRESRDSRPGHRIHGHDHGISINTMHTGTTTAETGRHKNGHRVKTCPACHKTGHKKDAIYCT